jgi:4-hydroxybenzoate polyprenyltransferase
MMLDEKLIQVLTEMQNAATKAAPQVLTLATQTKHWESVGNLAMGFGFLLVAFFIAVLAYRMSHAGIKGYFARERETKFTECTNGETTAFVVAVIGGAASLIVLIIGLVQVLDPWNWVGVYAPKVALFYDIYQKLTSHS